MSDTQNFNWRDFDPESYLIDESLQHAVDLARALDQPLLLTGEPGTGKTRLAYRVAYNLSRGKNGDFPWLSEPLEFRTKTTSSARDLFYTYDAVGHFQEANIKREETGGSAQTIDFVELQALGTAIALTEPEKYRELLGEEWFTGSDNRAAILGPTSSVVLIDEIDKAPRDFPNDILREIETYNFRIKELGNRHVEPGAGPHILTIMTSNSEKNLPDAFLRRCVFYDIQFPSPEQILDIAMAQLGIKEDRKKEMTGSFKPMISYFFKVRELAVRKPPATAELIGWLYMIGIPKSADKQNLEQLRDRLDKYLSLLLKTRDDLKAVKQWMKDDFVDWYEATSRG